MADRLKSADELAAETAAQLEELERRRLKRMRQRGSDDDASDDDDDAVPKGGYAAKRMKRSNRDADEPRKKARKETVRSPWFAPAALFRSCVLPHRRVMTSTAITRLRRRKATASCPTLTQRAPAAKTTRMAMTRTTQTPPMRTTCAINQRGDLKRGLRRLRRLGILKDGGDAGASSGSDAEDGSDEEDEEDEGEEEEEEDEDGSDEGEEEEDDAGEGSDEPEHAAPAARALHKAPAERLPSREAAVPQSRRAAGELPFTFQAPTTHAEFLRYVDGRSASDLGAVIERICACNAIALAPDNRQKLQVFFGVLLVHFEALAQQVPPPQGHLDVLAHRLLVRHRAWLVVCVAA